MDVNIKALTFDIMGIPQILQPDAVFILLCDPNEAKERFRHADEMNIIDNLNIDFHIAAHEAFMLLGKHMDHYSITSDIVNPNGLIKTLVNNIREVFMMDSMLYDPQHLANRIAEYMVLSKGRRQL